MSLLPQSAFANPNQASQRHVIPSVLTSFRPKVKVEIMPRLSVLCLIGSLLLMFGFADQANAQRATKLIGNWAQTGTVDDPARNLEISMRFEEDDVCRMQIGSEPPADPRSWANEGSWTVLEEKVTEEMFPEVIIKLIWKNSPDAEHNVVITFLEPDLIRIAFNSEPLRDYRRVDE